MEETGQFVSSHQDNVRNELIKMTLIMEIIAVALAFGAVISGIMGMNLTNHFEEKDYSFVECVAAMILLMVIVFLSFLMYYYWMKKDTRQAQSFNLLKNFFKAVDDLEFMRFKRKINKFEFLDAVRTITKMSIADQEGDFLFQMVDTDKDGLIDTEHELALGGTRHSSCSIDMEGNVNYGYRHSESMCSI